jgi:hypothetical protein
VHPDETRSEHLTACPSSRVGENINIESAERIEATSSFRDNASGIITPKTNMIMWLIANPDSD